MALSWVLLLAFVGCCYSYGEKFMKLEGKQCDNKKHSCVFDIITGVIDANFRLELSYNPQRNEDMESNEYVIDWKLTRLIDQIDEGYPDPYTMDTSPYHISSHYYVYDKLNPKGSDQATVRLRPISESLIVMKFIYSDFGVKSVRGRLYYIKTCPILNFEEEKLKAYACMEINIKGDDISVAAVSPFIPNNQY